MTKAEDTATIMEVSYNGRREERSDDAHCKGERSETSSEYCTRQGPVKGP